MVNIDLNATGKYWHGKKDRINNLWLMKNVRHCSKIRCLYLFNEYNATHAIEKASTLKSIVHMFVTEEVWMIFYEREKIDKKLDL